MRTAAHVYFPSKCSFINAIEDAKERIELVLNYSEQAMYHNVLNCLFADLSKK